MATESRDCCVCLEALNTPQAFGCGHTVCGACFPKLDGGCPLCRHGKPPVDHSACAPLPTCFICALALDPASLLVNVVLVGSGYGSILQCGHAYCKDHVVHLGTCRLPCSCPCLDVFMDNPRPTCMLFSNVFSPPRDVSGGPAGRCETCDEAPNNQTCPFCFRHGCAYCVRWKDYAAVQATRSSFHFPIRFSRPVRGRDPIKPRTLSLAARLASVSSFGEDPATLSAYFVVDAEFKSQALRLQANLEELCSKVGSFLSLQQRRPSKPVFYPFFRKSTRTHYGYDGDDDHYDSTVGFSLHMASLHPAFRTALSEAPSMARCKMHLVFTRGCVTLTSEGRVKPLAGLRYLEVVPDTVFDEFE